MDRVCIYYQSPHLFPESLGSHAVRPGHPSTVSSSLPVEMTVLSKKLEGRTSPGSPVVIAYAVILRVPLDPAGAGPQHMWNLLRSGIEPVSPVLAARFFTTTFENP